MGRNGVVTEWNPTFAGAVFDLGIGCLVAAQPIHVGEGMRLHLLVKPSLDEHPLQRGIQRAFFIVSTSADSIWICWNRLILHQRAVR
jgi:hypothetical protein